MAYVPRSLANFLGDVQHDVRDFLLDNRLGTLERFGGALSFRYCRATEILGRQQDAVYDALTADTRFDARTLWVAHDHMAAFWRHAVMATFVSSRVPWTTFEGKEYWHGSYSGALAGFRWWMLNQVEIWAGHDPVLLRIACIAMVADHNSVGRDAEIDLFGHLLRWYPVPKL